MQVVHTAGDPPNHGRMNRAISGCTWNSRKALRKIVVAKVSVNELRRQRAASDQRACCHGSTVGEPWRVCPRRLRLHHGRQRRAVLASLARALPPLDRIPRYRGHSMRSEAFGVVTAFRALRFRSGTACVRRRRQSCSPVVRSATTSLVQKSSRIQATCVGDPSPVFGRMSDNKQL